jgi:hypothetical protein
MSSQVQAQGGALTSRSDHTLFHTLLSCQFYLSAPLDPRVSEHARVLDGEHTRAVDEHTRAAHFVAISLLTKYPASTRQVAAHFS